MKLYLKKEDLPWSVHHGYRAQVPVGDGEHGHDTNGPGVMHEGHGQCPGLHVTEQEQRHHAYPQRHKQG